MRALVTGATGFVGRHLTELLLTQGYEVFGACWPGQPAPCDNPKCQFELCDLTDIDSLSSFVDQAQPQQVYHLAGLSSPLESLAKQREVYETNFLGTLNLLEVLRHSAPSARTLLVGSAQCYGSAVGSHMPLTEEDPLMPRNPYAVSKAAADLLGYQYFSAHKLHVIRARPANHTGPGQPPSFVCSDFARQIATIELGLAPPELHVGNTGVSRDFSDVRDIVRGYVLLVEKGCPGEAYNLGAGRAVALMEIVRLLTSFCSRQVQVVCDPGRVRDDDPKEVYVSIRKINADTGWSPKYSLASTLRDLFDYWISALRSEQASGVLRHAL